MSPAARVAFGLEQVAQGLAELRAERIALAEAMAANRASIGHVEGRVMALRYQSVRDRDARVPSQAGGLPPRYDGPRRLPAPGAVERVTEASLALYCPRGSAKEAPPALRRGLLSRIFGTGQP